MLSPIPLGTEFLKSKSSASPPLRAPASTYAASALGLRSRQVCQLTPEGRDLDRLIIVKFPESYLCI
jgi:hypothetical protein